MTPKTIIETIHRLLEDGEQLVAATIISHEGSTPRTAGSRMIVRKSGDIIGTIGGGGVEGRVLGTASEIFRSGKNRIVSFDLAHDEADGEDMICGGRLEVLLEFIEPSPRNLEIFQAAERAFQGDEKTYLITCLSGTDNNDLDIFRALIQGGEPVSGESHKFPRQRLDAILEQTRSARLPFSINLDEDRIWVEPLTGQNVLYIFGAGHVSKETAALAAQVGFYCVVLDDRPEFANKDRFPGPVETQVIAGFEDCFQDLQVNGNDYLVILTRGHLFDKIVLEQALKTDACYVGMIGSRHKRNTIFKALLDQGYSRKDIDRVHSPIGLEIGAETPEEIAVSIVAELIQVRARIEAPAG